MNPHYVLERMLRFRRLITGRYQPGPVLLKKFGKVEGTSHRRPLSAGRVLGRSSANSAGWGTGFLLTIWSDTQRMAAGLCAPTRDAFCAVQCADGVHKLSVSAGNGCPPMVDLRFST